MPLHYSLFPVVDGGAGAAIPLAPEPGLVANGATAKFRFGDVLSFGPPVQRLDQNGYMTMELRIFGLDTVTGAVTALSGGQVIATTATAPVRVGVGVRSPATNQVLYPANTIGARLSPEATGLDLGANWIQIGKPANSPRVADFLAQFDNGVFRIHIDAADDWASGQLEAEFNLELVVQNNSGGALRVVFTASDAGIFDAALPASNLQPWVHLDPLLNLGNLPGNAGSGALRIYNFGTAAATVGGTFQAQPAPLPGDPPLPSPFELNTTGTINNGGSLLGGQSRQLGFGVVLQAGQTAGKAQALFSLASDPKTTIGHALHNSQAALSADVGLLEVMLVLDGSGSMGSNGNGSIPSAPLGDRRWDKLREGTVAFLTQLFTRTMTAATRVRVGVVVFPKITPPQDAFGKEVLYPVSDLDLAFINTFDDRFDGPGALTPQGWTPMGEGLKEALAQLTGGSNDHQAVVIVSDGASNAGTDPRTVSLAVAEDKFALLYGTDSGINRDLLKDVVGTANVIDGILPAGSTNDPLGTAMSKIAANIVGLEGLEDPPGFVTSDEPVSVHDFRVSEFDQDVTIWIGWQRFDRRRLTIELISPRCELIRPRGREDLFFRGGNSHQVIFLPEELLLGTDTGEHRYGNWRLVVRLNGSNDDDGGEFEGGSEGGEIDREDYAYNIYSKTRFKLDLDLGIGDEALQTGSAFPARAALKLNGIPVRDATPLLQITRPVASIAQFLAATLVSLDTFERVRKEQEAQGVTEFWTIKSLALEAEGKVFSTATETISAAMAEAAPGIYVPSPAVIAQMPGNYKLRLIARGELRSGVPFRRETERDVTVKAALSVANTTLDVQHNLKSCTAVVCVRPRDPFGNPILFDPKISASFTLRARNAELVGELKPQLDGSYCQTLKLAAHAQANPIVDVIIDDKVVLSRAVPVPFGLVFVDRVVQHQPGDEKKANTHANPKAVLGPLEDSGEFLSLGAHGSVTVSVERERIVPGAVTVFVRPDRDLRAYKVETAVRPDSQQDKHFGFVGVLPHHLCWVEIGRSEGITETFAMPPGGDAAPIVRITDLSGRTISRPNEPLKTPGVSVSALGFKGRRSK